MAPNSNFELSLLLLALLVAWPDQLRDLGHLKSNLFLDDLRQSDVGSSHVAGLDQWPAHGSRPGIKLADAPRDEVYQNVGVSNFLQCFSCKFSVQGFFPRYLNRAR